MTTRETARMHLSLAVECAEAHVARLEESFAWWARCVWVPGFYQGEQRKAEEFYWSVAERLSVRRQELDLASCVLRHFDAAGDSS